MYLQVSLGEVSATTALAVVAGTAVSTHEHGTQSGLLHASHLVQTARAHLVLSLAARQTEHVLARYLKHNTTL